MYLRILAVVILLVSACAFPALLTLVLGVLCIVCFPRFYEIVPVFFINDVLYGVHLARYFHFMYVMTVLGLALVLLSVWIRAKMFRGSARALSWR